MDLDRPWNEEARQKLLEFFEHGVPPRMKCGEGRSEVDDLLGERRTHWIKLDSDCDEPVASLLFWIIKTGDVNFFADESGFYSENMHIQFKCLIHTIDFVTEIKNLPRLKSWQMTSYPNIDPWIDASTLTGWEKK